MRLPPQTPWLTDPDVRAVFQAVTGTGGYGLYFVGGCVRNALMGVAGSDIDLATDAPPNQVMALAQAAGLRAVPTGIDHGTVTVVSGGNGFEITTFRQDVQTDGRRARVSFAASMTQDARRRDFTINALYADLSGQVIDPLGGLPDLIARRVRFIEDAGARIREDYLRILRFFRFHAHYADPALGFDAATLDAIARNLDGLAALSSERVTSELRKLLGAGDPAPAVAAMRQTGVLARVLEGADDRLLAPVVHAEATLSLAPDWLLRLAAITALRAGLRLTRNEIRHFEALHKAAFDGPALSEVAYRQGTEVARGAMILRAVLAGTGVDCRDLPALARAGAAVFPLRGGDLPALKGKALGARLRQLEEIWIASDFALDKQALLNRARTL